MTDDAHAKVLERLRKLRAKAESCRAIGSLAEAEAFAAAARKLTETVDDLREGDDMPPADPTLTFATRLLVEAAYLRLRGHPGAARRVDAHTAEFYFPAATAALHADVADFRQGRALCDPDVLDRLRRELRDETDRVLGHAAHVARQRSRRWPRFEDAQWSDDKGGAKK